MRPLRATLLALVVLALCAGTASAAQVAKKGARLDPSFGSGGGGLTVATPKVEGSTFRSPVRLAISPSNKSYVQQGSLVLGFGANGRPDPGFAGHGRLTISSRVGAITEVAGVAVDSLGRILVAGSVEPVPGLQLNVIKGNRGAQFPPSRPVTEVFVERYLPNGTPDPTFGTNGEIDTTLASPRPVGTTESPAEYERPSVRAVHLAVDAENRPVLAAKFVQRVETCFYKSEVDQAIVARLSENGALDPSFGTGGVEKVGSETPIALAATPEGWATLSGPEVCEHGTNGVPTELSVLTGAGTPLPGLDPIRPRFPASEEVFAVDGQGRFLYTESGEVEPPPARVYRLLADGDPDTSFGHNGLIGLKNLGAETVGSLALDAKGRIVAGFGHSQLEVTRISSKGKIEGRFGDHGVIRSKLPEPTRLTALAIDSKGRIVAVGSAEGGSLKTGVGIGIARFLPGS